MPGNSYHLIRPLILLSFLVWSGAVLGQRYSFQNLGVDDGLIQSQAMCLAQDRTGNLWVGTLGGLSRFDGSSFTNFSTRNGLPENMVTALAADSAGCLWIGSQNGLARFNGRRFDHYFIPKSDGGRASSNMAQNRTLAALQLVHDTAWWWNGGDIYTVHEGRVKSMVTPCRAGTTTAMLAETGALWVAQGDTLFHLVGSRWDTLSFIRKDKTPFPSITKIFRDSRKRVWVGTNAGLYYLDSNRLKLVALKHQPLHFFAVNGIAEDRTGALWLTTRSGVYKLDSENLVYFNKKNGLSNNLFHFVMPDIEGNVWLASDGQGIFRFTGNQFTSIDETQGLPSAQIMAIAHNQKDSLFLGTLEAGLFLFKDGKVSPLTLPVGNKLSITSLYYTHNHSLWIGTAEQGLFQLARNRFRQFAPPHPCFPSATIYAVYEDLEHRLWIGFGNGATKFENDSFKAVDIQGARVQSFLSIGRDSVLIATSKRGLLLYNNGAVNDYNTGTLVDSSTIDCAIKLGDELWFGTSDNGVIRYHSRSHETAVYNKMNGLRSDFIYNINSDEQGNVFAGTGYGIYKITVQGSEKGHINFYGKADGMTGMESNINASLRAAGGGMWFGTTNGAFHYEPKSLPETSAPISVVLQSVRLVGESNIDRNFFDSTDNWYSIPYHLKLPYKNNSLSFDFKGITLSGTDGVNYRFRMDGIDQQWSDWSSNHTVNYSSLEPGLYSFKVECRNTDNGDHYASLTYSFEVIAPFRKTVWFKLMVLGICIFVGIVLQSIITSSHRRKQKMMAKLRSEEQAKIRMRTAEDFHDEVGNKLTRINVLTNVLKSKLGPSPDARLLDQIQENTDLLYSGTRDILWSLKPSNDNLFEILSRVQEFGNDLFQDTDIRFMVNGIDEKFRKYRLPMDMSRNFIMIFKEALNNALKYADARSVTLEVMSKGRDVLQLILRDDGKGFDMHNQKKGNGINNMMVRAERLGGRLYFDTHPGKGTIITLTFRISKG